ncbi:hypothetical protein BDR04DRAFT_1038237 [Suillus decipiens]|nr:hypothetical protein BDR04DRAFT_1038237 [Suillus decipiens]
MKLVASLPRCLTSIYVQLRTRHAPLNHHLHRIGKADSPRSPFFPEKDETTHHFLLDCHQYVHERHIMSNTLRRQAATSIYFLLTSEKATSPIN